MAQGEATQPLESESGDPVDVARYGVLSVKDDETRALLKAILDKLEELTLLIHMKG